MAVNKPLKQFKLTIGDFNGCELDSYYNNFLDMAVAALSRDDISEDVLNGELGQALICLYAEALKNKTDIATNTTITLLRDKLSTMTKGDKLDV